MSAIPVTIDIHGQLDEELKRIADDLEDPALLHAVIAADAEVFVKTRGAETAATEHRTANRLGATPTGHLADAYDAIEGQSSADGAVLLVPRASRLAAAFGPVLVKPGAGKYYLTIPVAKDAYGHRAGEFDDLFFAHVGPFSDPVLARLKGFSAVNKRSGPGIGAQLEVMYALVTEANIPADPSLIPFDDLETKALGSAEKYLDGILEGSLA